MNYRDDSFTTHQSRTVYDSSNGTTNHFWDANGNLAQVVDRNHNAARLHEWDEENRLTFVLGNRYAGYYGYDANGERVYKLVGTTSLNQLNGGYMDANVLFDACVLYPNPYIVVTKTGYTKHYYAGTERLATVIGGGGLGDIGNPINHLSSQHDLGIVSSFHSRYSDSDPFEHANNVSEPVGTVGIDGISHSELDYTCSPIILTELDVLTHQNILLEAIEQNAPTMTLEQNVYFFHGDHLGSANWITDGGGNPIQYIHYAPYGEQIANQQTIGYDERFKFTGKERDAETGYDYFGARFYWSADGIFTTVDPLADKYPGNTPYLYCGGNPIMLVDPDGRDIYRYDNETGNFYLYQKTNDNFDQVGKFRFNKKTGEYELKRNKDGTIKTYSAHKNSDGKIAKGILYDGLNIKQNGKTFVSDKNCPKVDDYFKFALLLDKVAGVEISGYVFNLIGDITKQAIHIDSYKNNSHNRSYSFADTYPETYENIQQFHTHGHAGYSEAVKPSEKYDIPFKNKSIQNNPGKNIIYLILHNYGAPIRY